MEHLIPTEWFVGRSQAFLLLVGAVAVVALAKGADWLVESAAGAAYRLGLPKVIVGATIVSLGTTSPECAVSVMAAWTGRPGLALGNAVGSIIADTALIFGLGCLIARLPAERFVLQRQGWVQFGSGVLLAAVCYGSFLVSGADARIARWVGLAFLGLLAAYLYVSVQWSRRHPCGEPSGVAGLEEIVEAGPRTPGWKLALWGMAGLAVVIVASHVMILSVTELAEAHWHVPQVVIAATLVALGTSLPELVIGVVSVLKGHREILVGNVIGADVLNVLFVVGASASAAPLPILEPGARMPDVLLRIHLPTMLAVLVLFRVYIAASSGRGFFRRWYGVPMVVAYVVYVVLQYWLG